jgi:hypothetical protein
MRFGGAVRTPKIVRTPREWAETCRHCNGKGVVARREHFALWTPDEYRAEPLDARHDAPHDAYVCTGVPGATIFEACKEGVTLAAIVKRPVAFEFNGAVAVCREGEDPGAIAKAWRIRAYGMTHEQAMRER